MEISLVPELITTVFGFPITNSVLTTIIVSAIIILASLYLQKNLSKKPKGFQNIVEAILEALLNLADSVTGNREQSKKFFPYVATIFIFVIVSNWIG
ncbi:MAG: ATP synthase subunit a, partial [Candidatus Moranbacteria bacterium GW2011_GWF2_34_56]